MGPTLSSLIDLQTIEARVRKTREQLRKGQQRVKKQHIKIEQLEAAFKAKKEEIKLSMMQRDRLDVELRSREDEVTKLRVQLNSAKTNKEYSSILSRINTEKADNSKLEDQELQLMTLIDNDKAACAELEASIVEEKAKLEEIENAVQEQQSNVEDELNQQLQMRQEIYDKVPAKYQIMFDRLADRYDGEVLAEVTQGGNSKTEYNCEGCYMKVPLEAVNSLMTRDEVVTCPSCGRMLVLDKQPKRQPAT